MNGDFCWWMYISHPYACDILRIQDHMHHHLQSIAAIPVRQSHIHYRNLFIGSHTCWQGGGAVVLVMGDLASDPPCSFYTFGGLQRSGLLQYIVHKQVVM